MCERERETLTRQRLNKVDGCPKWLLFSTTLDMIFSV